MSLAGSAPSCQIGPAAIIKFLPGSHAKEVEECAKCFKIPNMTAWCPTTLMDSSLINNYYNQRALDAVSSLHCVNYRSNQLNGLEGVPAKSPPPLSK